MAERPDPRRRAAARPRRRRLRQPFNGPLVHEVVVAELAARRQGTALDQDPRHGPRRRRQAVAPEGHRPRPRRHDPLADLDRRRHRLRPAARATTPSRSTARRAAPRCAARCRCTPSAARSSSLDAGRVRRARRPSRPPSCCDDRRGGSRADRARAEDELTAAKSFRNLARVHVAAGRRRRRRRPRRRRDARRLRRPRSSTACTARAARRRRGV